MSSCVTRVVVCANKRPKPQPSSVVCYNRDGFESLCLEITIGKSKTVITCIYKHPKVTNELFIKYFSRLSDMLWRSHDDFVYLGDMNCCPIKYHAIENICEQYDLTNLIKEPTCHKGPTPSLLDVILVSNSRRYASTFNVFCGLSDFHNIIGAATKRFAPSQKPRIIHYRSFKKFAEPEFLYDIACAPFHVMEIFDDVDDMAWYTSALIRSIIDEHAPMKSKVVKSASVPYMNSALRKAQYKRNMARNKFHIELKLDRNTILSSERSVKALGVTIDYRLTFNDHISACCLKAARQLNALARISKYLDIKSKKIIFNSFIRSNFEYCPLVWHFCGKTNNQKLEKIQERSLRILHDTFELTYEELLHKNASSSLLLYRLKLFIIETYKSFHRVNAECLHDLFQLNNTTYETRPHKLIQPKRKTTSNGLRTFSYLGSKLWNDLVNSEPAIANVEFDELIEFLKDWEGPNTNDGSPYVWHVPCLIFLCILCITFLHMSCSESFLCIPYFMYISTALYIFCTQSYTSLLANVVCFKYDVK